MVQSQYGWSNGFTGVHQYNINEQQIDFWTKSSGTEENERTIEIEIQVVFEVNTRRATLYTRIEKNKEKNEHYTHDNRIELCVVATQRMCTVDPVRAGGVLRKHTLSFLSCRAYGKHGMTAVTRLAEAILHALIMISSSIRLSLISPEPDCTMYTSSPRTDSPISTLCGTVGMVLFKCLQTFLIIPYSGFTMLLNKPYV